jgi:hypothetical protein
MKIVLRRGTSIFATILAAMLAMAAMAPVAMAKPTAGDVFKSIQDNVNDSSDDSMRGALPWICAGAGLVIILAIFSKRQSKQASPAPINNPNRLAREVLKAVPIKPHEYKQVKIVADETTLGTDQNVCSPLVLLLCPSILMKAARNRESRADRQVLLQILKKLEVRPAEKKDV